MHGPSDESLREALHLNWRHARHAEKQRFWFSSVYAAIVGGSLVILGTGLFDDPAIIPVFGYGIPLGPTALLAFLAFLTFTGVVIVLKTALGFYYHAAQASALAETMGLGEWSGGTYGTPLYAGDEEINTILLLSIGPWYLMMYLAMLAILSGIVVYVTTNALALSAGTGGLVLVSISLGCYVYLKRRFESIDAHVEASHDTGQRQLSEF